MKPLVTAALVVASLTSPSAIACKKANTADSTAQVDKKKKAGKVEAKKEDKSAAAFKTASVKDVADQLATSKSAKQPTVAVFDANTVETRESQGIIPTAVLLPSSSDYDVSVLPKDKATPVVFYCANEKCTASHTAAKRAIGAGHSDVSVLSAGIKGWVAAGQPVDKPVG